jgi:3-hydroxy acid dehydrogenase / malonic semialdehyde reductase
MRFFFNFAASNRRSCFMQKTVLITGATSGIGEATARILSKNGFRLILTGRRKDRLNALKEDLGTNIKSDVCTLVFDIRDFESTKTAIDSIHPDFKNIDVLINNAGLAAGLNKLHEGDLDDWEQMIDTNIKGLLYITRLISPGMVERKKGHIINISSIAGRETYPNGNVYCATKYAVESLTRAMRIDMLQYGIKVSAVSPGAVNTEFSLVRFKGDKSRAESVYNGFTPLEATDVAEAILFVVTRPEHVNIDDILIMPKAQAYSRDFHRNTSSI